MSSVLIASALGIAVAVGRAAAVWGSRHDLRDGALTGYDRMGIEITKNVMRVESNAERYRELQADMRFFVGKYYRYPLATLLHVIPGALFFILAPLQFSQTIRTRYTAFHRWSGRFLLACALPLAMSAFFFGAMPFGGLGETVAAAVFGGLFVYAAARAWRAIRRRDIVIHREWMIRTFAVVMGVSTVRVVDVVLVAVTDVGTRATFVPSLWIGWILTLALAEGWIRYTRQSLTRSARPGTSSRPAFEPRPQPHSPLRT